MNRLFSLLIVGFLCIINPVYSAAQLFHAIIADRWCNTFENYNEEEKREFFLGTIFPDIRYPGKLPRESTHQHGLTINQIRETSSPFLKGMRVHGLVDEIRAEVAKKSSYVKSLGHELNAHSFLLKMIEDEVLYDTGNDVHYISKYFETISEEERKFGISNDVLENWHKVHIGYFSERPSDYLEKVLKSGEKFGDASQKTIKNLYEAMVKFRNNRSMQIYVSSQIAEFDRVFSTISEHNRAFDQ